MVLIISDSVFARLQSSNRTLGAKPVLRVCDSCAILDSTPHILLRQIKALPFGSRLSLTSS